MINYLKKLKIYYLYNKFSIHICFFLSVLSIADRVFKLKLGFDLEYIIIQMLLMVFFVNSFSENRESILNFLIHIGSSRKKYFLDSMVFHNILAIVFAAFQTALVWMYANNLADNKLDGYLGFSYTELTDNGIFTIFLVNLVFIALLFSIKFLISCALEDGWAILLVILAICYVPFFFKLILSSNSSFFIFYRNCIIATIINYYFCWLFTRKVEIKKGGYSYEIGNTN